MFLLALAIHSLSLKFIDIGAILSYLQFVIANTRENDLNLEAGHGLKVINVTSADFTKIKML